MLAHREGDQIVHPGLASAHSHAFQRALRGHCQRPQSSLESFWSWRGTMYALAANLDPESMFQIARFAYAELAMSGVTAVGEFHYVHHQASGQPYDNRTEMADALIRAAKDVGIRICLQRVLYERGGFRTTLSDVQRRFCDPSVDLGLRDLQSLCARYKSDPLVTIGVAIHSVRAVSLDWIFEASKFAKQQKIPLHMHLSEQQRELSECRQEHGTTPVALMRNHEILDRQFVAVHATHLDGEEVTALGEAGTTVCVCRTTERDLGDGHCDARALAQSGVRLCTGTDSHASSDPYEEVRAIELDQRTADEGRTRVGDATHLLRAASENGYTAIGMESLCHQDQVRLDALHPALVGATEEHIDDTVVFAASPGAVQQVRVGAEWIVNNGVHRNYPEIRRSYEKALQPLLSV